MFFFRAPVAAGRLASTLGRSKSRFVTSCLRRSIVSVCQRFRSPSRRLRQHRVSLLPHDTSAPSGGGRLWRFLSSWLLLESPVFAFAWAQRYRFAHGLRHASLPFLLQRPNPALKRTPQARGFARVPGSRLASTLGIALAGISVMPARLLAAAVAMAQSIGGCGLDRSG